MDRGSPKICTNNVDILPNNYNVPNGVGVGVEIIRLKA